MCCLHIFVFLHLFYNTVMRRLIHVANMALINSENKILFLRRSDNIDRSGVWGFPGGMIDVGESSIMAAKREVFEETGIEENKYSIANQQTFLAHNADQDVEITLFKAGLLTSVEVTIDEDEHSDFSWFDIEKISDVENIMPGIPDMLLKLLGTVNS
jgi:8-oxo-dGTP diphosphatase